MSSLTMYIINSLLFILMNYMILLLNWLNSMFYKVHYGIQNDGEDSNIEVLFQNHTQALEERFDQKMDQVMLTITALMNAQQMILDNMDTRHSNGVVANAQTPPTAASSNANGGTTSHNAEEKMYSLPKEEDKINESNWYNDLTADEIKKMIYSVPKKEDKDLILNRLKCMQDTNKDCINQIHEILYKNTEYKEELESYFSKNINPIFRNYISYNEIKSEMEEQKKSENKIKIFIEKKFNQLKDAVNDNDIEDKELLEHLINLFQSANCIPIKEVFWNNKLIELHKEFKSNIN